MLGAELLVDTLARIASGTVVETPQDESGAIYAPRLTKDEGLVDYAAPALALHNQIRGLRPWPMAFTFLGNARLVLHEARLSPHDPGDALPGTIVRIDRALTVAAGDRRSIDILQLQPEGRRVMTAREFLAGHTGLRGRRLG